MKNDDEPFGEAAHDAFFYDFGQKKDRKRVNDDAFIARRGRFFKKKE
ncbi:MAG: hypothetical protein OEV64_01230 [Desulfobulbaceae bacterium]|nr:hypothetical protein [Desulfobulbaceae bacterium]